MPIISIGGYQIERVVHRGPVFTLHSGRHATDPTPVLLKTATEYSDGAADERLEWEYELARV